MSLALLCLVTSRGGPKPTIGELALHSYFRNQWCFFPLVLTEIVFFFKQTSQNKNLIIPNSFLCFSTCLPVPQRQKQQDSPIDQTPEFKAGAETVIQSSGMICDPMSKRRSLRAKDEAPCGSGARAPRLLQRLQATSSAKQAVLFQPSLCQLRFGSTRVHHFLRFLRSASYITSQ